MTSRSLLLPLAVTVLLAGCGGTIKHASSGASPSAGDWGLTLRAARGQTVRFWMYGGDERVNAYVDDDVAPALRRLGVRLQRVPITDTADALKRVVAERRAGQNQGGGVDLVWINGENFATGKRAGLWLKSWSRRLPNARRYVNWHDPSIATDFQVPVDGQESPWQRATFIYAYDRARTPRPPRDLDELLAYAKAHPGRVTYPAPPDFTGSAFIRQVVAAKGADGAFAYLKALNPYLYRHGTVFPKSQAELEQLFGDGQVDFAMAYDPNFVNADVRKGLFPRTARPFILGDRALTNVSYVTIPANAAHVAGAEVLANLLLDPRLQAEKADPAVLGNPTVLDTSRLPATSPLVTHAVSGPSPFLLSDFGRPVGEFAAADVAPLEQRWQREVLG
jgi:putative spermidine/putrescine transport system substrate-binding protein